ncbi:UNVERIFIED_CONTAM: hypothetical protein GTU68_011562 [Idotea baltica]|nr:hypothetical protein [Idotea baltica]
MMNDNWQTNIDIDILKRRAQLLADVRLFFANKQVMEVTTPMLSQAAPTAPYLESFETHYIPLGTDQKQAYYLHTSPEFAMKQLLAAGSGSIYQITKAFRNGECGRAHSPEFMMLEWYRHELTMMQLMDEVAELLIAVAGFSSIARQSYDAVFKQHLNIDVFDCTEQDLKKIALSKITGLTTDLDLNHDGWLELLMSQLIEPKLAEQYQAVFIYDFPASQAQLAKIRNDDNGRQVAARFELYAGGLELANGYDELLDAQILRARFEQDNQRRQDLNKPIMPIDERLLTAMQVGLPQCVGVAVGLDRILMLMVESKNIQQVQLFPF